MNEEMCANLSYNTAFGQQLLYQVIPKSPAGGVRAPRVLPAMVRGFHFPNGVLVIVAEQGLEQEVEKSCFAHNSEFSKLGIFFLSPHRQPLWLGLALLLSSPLTPSRGHRLRTEHKKASSVTLAFPSQSAQAKACLPWNSNTS